MRAFSQTALFSTKTQLARSFPATIACAAGASMCLLFTKHSYPKQNAQLLNLSINLSIYLCNYLVAKQLAALFIAHFTHPSLFSDSQFVL